MFILIGYLANQRLAIFQEPCPYGQVVVWREDLAGISLRKCLGTGKCCKEQKDTSHSHMDYFAFTVGMIPQSHGLTQVR